jgi:HPt (histidine-containing phosphotransfer) domain-containing protein
MNDTVIDPHTFDELQANAGADFVIELVDTFAEEAPGLLIELRTAKSQDAAERFRRAAHSLKSNSSTFGAQRLAALARQLELDGVSSDMAALDALAREFDVTLAALQAMARQ